MLCILQLHSISVFPFTYFPIISISELRLLILFKKISVRSFNDLFINHHLLTSLTSPTPDINTKFPF